MIMTSDEIVEQYEKEQGWKKDTEFTAKKWIEANKVKDVLLKTPIEHDLNGLITMHVLQLLKELGLE